MKTHIPHRGWILGSVLLAATTAMSSPARAERPPVASQTPRALGPLRGPIKGAQLERERSLSRSLMREARAAAQRRFLSLPWTAPYGIEMETAAQVEVRRQVFYGLARITGESRLLRVVSTDPAPLGDRALREIETQIRMRRRGSFVELEEVKGNARHYISPAAEATAASAGALLCAGGMLGAKLLPALIPRDRLVVRPQPWPTGVTLGGTFDQP
jgi:hypothetical protein